MTEEYSMTSEKLKEMEEEYIKSFFPLIGFLSDFVQERSFHSLPASERKRAGSSITSALRLMESMHTHLIFQKYLYAEGLKLEEDSLEMDKDLKKSAVSAFHDLDSLMQKTPLLIKEHRQQCKYVLGQILHYYNSRSKPGVVKSSEPPWIP
ncbi:hypothetical protein J9317_03755 [Metabacillus sp. KIGAM252]|uniref:Uncharacterized protein n=1 Tax=Metabacillus flavus TaxID=2823519 RepID=A0ABS5LB02_9BACI|nr:hypothetical protein [Metabacillus flavus]MBS2967890.1 hypothetical protein [Metabacillus flavus]